MVFFDRILFIFFHIKWAKFTILALELGFHYHHHCELMLWFPLLLLLLHRTHFLISIAVVAEVDAFGCPIVIADDDVRNFIPNAIAIAHTITSEMNKRKYNTLLTVDD